MKVINQKFTITSISLEREVVSDLYYPENFNPNLPYPLLILNDGQDTEALDLKIILSDLWKMKLCCPFIVVAPHTTNRMHEYGVAGIPDFKGRGSKAIEYSKFVVEELIVQTKHHLKTTNIQEFSIAGFSLGALSAFDIAWNHSHIFSNVGACSGSFWWRKKDLADNYTDADRIMHSVVKATLVKPKLCIMLQCGSLDEKADRNNNGVIDSIDDTLDLITELENHGFVKDEDLHFELIIGGRHTQETYTIMLANFMKLTYRTSPNH